MSLARRFVHGEGGATVVEFALVAPVLIFALVACLDFARALNAYVTITNASREGARYCTLQSCANADQVRAYLATRVAPLNPSGPPGGPFGITLAYTPTTDLRWTPEAAPETVTIGVSYEWTAATWLAGSFFSAACGCRTFSASSSMEVLR